MKQYDSYKDSGVQWIGRIPSHWDVCRLKNYCSLSGRIGWNGLRADEFKDNSYAYLVTGQDFIKADIDWSNCYQIDKARYDEDPFIQLRNGDLLITKDGTIGKIARVSGLDKPACLNSGIFVMKQRKIVFDQDFLYWLLVSNLFKEFNSYTSSGTTILHLYQNVFVNMPMLIPPLQEQLSIAHYLEKRCAEIDKTIAMQKNRIELLLELRQNIITNAVTRGINPEVPLKDSGVKWIGMVPEHWEICAFKRKIVINNGRDYKEFLDSEIYPVMGSGGCFAYCSKYMYDGEAVLLGRKGTIDKPLYINGKFWAVDTMFYAVPKKELNCKFAYYLALTFPFNYYSTSTALPSMTQSDLGNNPVAFPPLEEQHSIVTYIEAETAKLDKQIAKANRQISLLQELKQSIITEVVTGNRKVC